VGEEAALISRKGSCQRLTIRNDSQKERIMKQRVQVIGNLLSPYVRKVLVCLDLKGVPYEIDPIVPFFGDDRFSQVSPVRRIPVLVDEQVTLADSSVICQYLEDRYPEPNLYPANIVDRARARWLEEFADSRMGEVFIWKLFNQVAIKPFVWGEPTDTAVVEKTLREEIPQVLDYLEAQALLPQRGLRPVSRRCGSLAPHGRVRGARAEDRELREAQAFRRSAAAHASRGAQSRTGGNGSAVDAGHARHEHAAAWNDAH
jgi:Glutathione S-transferase, N-terminal domain